MNERTIAVVTAGLTTPSSTRLLADQLAAAVRMPWTSRGSRARSWWSSFATTHTI
jgi:FMN reductase